MISKRGTVQHIGPWFLGAMAFYVPESPTWARKRSLKFGMRYRLPQDLNLRIVEPDALITPLIRCPAFLSDLADPPYPPTTLRGG
jgi:hypothetical protein